GARKAPNFRRAIGFLRAEFFLSALKQATGWASPRQSRPGGWQPRASARPIAPYRPDLGVRVGAKPGSVWQQFGLKGARADPAPAGGRLKRAFSFIRGSS